MRYRFFRAPGGIVAEAEELNQDNRIDLDGYKFEVFGDHDADLRRLVAKLRRQVAEGIARSFLTRESGKLLLKDNEVEGRLVWDDDRDPQMGKPYAVVVDGRRLTWEEFGLALEPYEGWRFKLSIVDTEEVSPGPRAEAAWWTDLDWTREEES